MTGWRVANRRSRLCCVLQHVETDWIEITGGCRCSIGALHVDVSRRVHRRSERRTRQPGRRRLYAAARVVRFRRAGESGQAIRPAGDLVDRIRATGAVLVGRGVPGNRPIITEVIITACRSSCSATGRRLPQSANYSSVPYLTNEIAAPWLRRRRRPGTGTCSCTVLTWRSRALKAGVLDDTTDPSDPRAPRRRRAVVRHTCRRGSNWRSCR